MMELKGKKVLVVGLGKSGLAAALFLRRRGAQVTVSDIRSAEALAKDIPALLEEGINVEAGGHGLLTFRRQDLIVVSPGVPLDTPELVQARNFGRPVIGELELAARFLSGKILAVTGSNGKTTTTSLLGEILEHAGMPTLVGGNIGVPVVALIDECDRRHLVGPRGLQLPARIAPSSSTPPSPSSSTSPPTTSIAMAASKTMRSPKSASSPRKTSTTTPFSTPTTSAPPLPPSAPRQRFTGFPWNTRWSKGHGPKAARSLFRPRTGAAPETVMPLSSIPLKGEHNVENVLAAVCAARLAGAPAESIRTAVEQFKAVEHRLEYVATLNGVEIYNDSKATNVDATAKAIAAFPGNIHLILGGKDKNSDYTELSDLLRSRVKAVYTIGSAAAKIESQLRGVVTIHSCETLDKAVSAIAAAARPGDTVLLAPACSSFDQFESYEHRGRIFKELVNEWRGWKVWQNA